MDGEQATGWALDKRVPVALILTLILQTFAAVWWASAQERRMVDVERRVGNLEQTTSAAGTEARQVGVLIARVDERMTLQTRTLERLERMIEAVTRQGGAQRGEP